MELKDPEHPQWKRRRRWNGAGAVVGLAGFVASGIAVIAGNANDAVVGFAWASGSLFLISSGIYVGTALLRNK